MKQIINIFVWLLGFLGWMSLYWLYGNDFIRCPDLAFMFGIGILIGCIDVIIYNVYIK